MLGFGLPGKCLHACMGDQQHVAQQHFVSCGHFHEDGSWVSRITHLVQHYMSFDMSGNVSTPTPTSPQFKLGIKLLFKQFFKLPGGRGRGGKMTPSMGPGPGP